MPVNEKKRAALIAKLDGLIKDDSEPPAVSLAEFLDGNDDEDSLAVNMGVGLSEFRSVLAKVAKRKDVQDVYVQVVDLMEDDPECWVYSDTLMVYTTATDEDEVPAWFGECHPDEYRKMDADELPPGAPPAKAGQMIVWCWYD